MAATEEELSPEEKLLKVIQGGEPGKGELSDGGASDKSLDKSGTDVGGGAAPARGGRPTIGAIGMLGGGSDMAPKKPAGKGFGIGMVNKSLVIVAVIMFGFSGLEVWDNVKAKPIVPPLPNIADKSFIIEEAEPPPLADILDSFEKRQIVGFLPDPEDPVRPPPTPGTTNRTTTIEIGEAIKYARDSLDLIGLSLPPQMGSATRGGEVIIRDTKENKTYFLEEGQRFLAGEHQLVVAEIHSDHVVITTPDGNQKVMIK